MNVIESIDLQLILSSLLLLLATFLLSASGNQYRVSSKDGWEVDKSYFVKESLMIRADNCEQGVD